MGESWALTKLRPESAHYTYVKYQFIKKISFIFDFDLPKKAKFSARWLHLWVVINIEKGFLCQEILSIGRESKSSVLPLTSTRHFDTNSLQRHVTSTFITSTTHYDTKKQRKKQKIFNCPHVIPAENHSNFIFFSCASMCW